MSPNANQDSVQRRRGYTAEFKREAVQMMLDGHSPKSVADRLGVSNTTLLYRWRRQHLEQAGPVGNALDTRKKELEAELRRVERERDVLKKALIIFGRGD